MRFPVEILMHIIFHNFFDYKPGLVALYADNLSS